MADLTFKNQEVTLLDLLDRILNKGVYLWGDITLSVADVDLVYLSLKVLLCSVEKALEMRQLGIQRECRSSTVERTKTLPAGRSEAR